MAGTISENLEELPEDEEELEDETEAEFGQPVEPRKPKAPKEQKGTEKGTSEKAEKGIEKEAEAGGKAATGAATKGAGAAAGTATKMGTKALAGIGAKTAAGAAGTAVGGPIGTAAGYVAAAAIEPVWKYGKWFVFVIMLILFSIILLMALMLFSIGSFGRLGTKPVTDLNPKAKADYYDVMQDLGLNGDKQKKIKLLTEKTDEIIKRLQGMIDDLNKMEQKPEIKESVSLMNDMILITIDISQLGRSINNTVQTDQEKKIKQEEGNKEIKKKIDEKYKEWDDTWKKFEKVYPGFQGSKNVDTYIGYLKSKGLSPIKGDGFYAERGVSQYRSVPGIHDGYDIIYGQDKPIYAGWPGTVKTVYYVSYSNNVEKGMEIDYGPYQIFYNHIYNPKVSPGTAVTKGTVLGSIYRDHVDIKIKKNGKFYDWGTDPVQ